MSPPSTARSRPFSMASACFAAPLAPLPSSTRKPILPALHSKPRAQPGAPASRRALQAPSMSSVETPDFFSTKWYQTAPLDLEQSSHHIPNQDAAKTDHHFVNPARGLMALIDYPAQPHQPSPAPQMLTYIEQRLQQTTQYSHEPGIDLRTVLASAIHAFGAPPGFSALITHVSSNMVRAAWVGTCGFVLVRDDQIHFRSYGDSIGADALEHLLNDPPQEHLPHHQPTGGYTPAPAVSIPPSTSVDVASIRTEYMELQDNDLLICGSDGLFSNVSEKQILAFVRPVTDAEDPTLAIANNTCLGSWRYDDVQFIAYYLAIIAANFATARNSRPHLPFPFPPSPHLDDVTVLCAAVSFGE